LIIIASQRKESPEETATSFARAASHIAIKAATSTIATYWKIVSVRGEKVGWSEGG